MKRILKALGWTCGVLLTLVLAAVAVGWFLPVEHTATADRVVAGSPEEVFAVITDVEAMPSWRPGIESTEQLGGQGLPVWRESGPMGTMTLEVTVLAYPWRIVTRIADEDLPFGGTWTYALEAAPGGTHVTLTEDGEIYNPFYRFVARFIMGYEGTMVAYLDGLEARMAGGGS